MGTVPRGLSPRLGQQLLERGLEPAVAGLAHLERQPERGGGALGGCAQLRRRALREPDDPRVVAEVVVAQLRVAVEPEPADDDAVERAHEEVGQEIRAGLLGERLVHGLPRKEVVAVVALEPREAVERAAGAAVGVSDSDLLVAAGELLDRGRDPLGPVVQLRRQRHDLDVPAAPGRDRAHVQGEGAAGDHRRPHPGKASGSMNRSLRSARPESSTYSTSSSTAWAAARSCTDSATIFAPSPATFPAETMRVSGSFGTRPILTALAGERYEPNEPASSTCAISSGWIPRSRQRSDQPVAIEAFAN